MEKTETQYRNDIIEICKRVYANGWVASNDGNVSIKINENTFLCTPTGMSKGFLDSSQLIKVDAEGNMIDGFLKPSSEIKMHLDIYKRKDNINAVVHAHPPFATGYAVAGIPLDECIMPEIIIGLGSIPLTGFGTPSTMEIPENVRPYLKEHNVFLLENHGALSIGNDVFQAYYRMESLELFAKISFISKLLGGAHVLSEEDAKKVIKVREKFGLDTENYPGCKVNGKIFKSADDSGAGTVAGTGAGKNQANGNGNTAEGNETIVITKDKLVDIVTTIVKNIIAEK
jgi:L-fuculose-phosphate aldolase